jgi:hypothetical protein
MAHAIVFSCSSICAYSLREETFNIWIARIEDGRRTLHNVMHCEAREKTACTRMS